MKRFLQIQSVSSVIVVGIIGELNSINFNYGHYSNINYSFLGE